MAKFYKISTQSGEKIDLTLNLGAIAELSKSKKDLADRYFKLYKKMQRQEEIDELEMGEIFYIAYACAHIGEDIPDLNSFLYELTDSREEMGQVFQALFGIQEKKQGFPGHSKKQHGRTNRA